MSRAAARSGKRAPVPVAEMVAGIEKALAEDAALRIDLGRGERLHIDRPLPFLVIHRLDRPARAAQSVATANASYLLYSNVSRAKKIIAAVGKAICERFGAFLVIEIAELAEDRLAEDAVHLPPFEIEIAATPDRPAQAALSALAAAIEGTDVKFRRPRLVTADLAADAPLLKLSRYAALSLKFAPIYRAGEGDVVYPDLNERVVENFVDAILQGAADFVRRTTRLSLASHRALGRKVFIETVNRADRAMDEVAQSFDFLLAVTPINAGPAFEAFERAGFARPPRFLYRPLTVGIDRQKRALFSIDLDRFEDPVLSALYKEKRAELDLQLSMIAARETPRFREFGRALYGPVEPGLLERALAILDEVTPDRGGVEKAIVGSAFVRRRAEAMIADYAGQNADFRARAELRDDLPSGLMVSGPRLLISRTTSMPRARVEALLSHEVGVHLLTYFNGSAQGLRLFRSGLAGYEGVQEGLAVLSEYLVGGMTPQRLRLIAARVVACAMMLDDAAFEDVFARLAGRYGFAEPTAFTIALRVYRGGGLAKDAVYLRGLFEILAHLEGGGGLEAFWMGKIAASHFPVILELGSRGLLKPPLILPRFLDHKGASARLDKARAGLSPLDMIAP